MKNENVSIIIPIYNVEPYLRECLDSVCAQTYQNIEIICIDDGSTDNCGKILDEYAGKESRIVVIHKPNAGYGKAVNDGLRVATGKYVQVVESDDYIPDNMTETLVRIAEKYELDVVKADFNIFIGEDPDRKYQYVNIAKPYQYNQVLNAKCDMSIFENGMYTWAGLFRREFLEKNSIWHNETEGASFQDNGFWFQTIALAERVMYIDEALYCLRRDNPNSSCFSDNKVYAMSNEYDFIKSFIINKLYGNKSYLYLHNSFRLGAYQYIAERLNEKYIQKFQNKVFSDIRREASQGNIDVANMSSALVQVYSDIVENNPDWIYRAKYFVNYEKVRRLYNASHIILYGAGKIGEKVLEKYRLHHLPVIGFAVTAYDGIDEKAGMPVKTMEDWAENALEDALVVVSVAEKNRDEIVKVLKLKNFDNYILLDK